MATTPSEKLQTDETSRTLPGEYDKALRVIGNALEAQEVVGFELTCEDKNYIIRVKSHRRKTLPLKGLQKGFEILDLLRNGHHSFGFELIYTPGDIERLQREGKLRRRNARTEPHTLTQALRAIGFYLDLTGARLLQICKNGSWMKIRYENALGDYETREFTSYCLYALFLKMYAKRRGPKPNNSDPNLES